MQTVFDTKEGVVTAVQWTGDNLGEARNVGLRNFEIDGEGLKILSKEEWKRVRIGEWIVRGEDGEVYSCEESTFPPKEPAREERRGTEARRKG